MLLNNLGDYFNNVIIEARGKPTLSTLEHIRVYVMRRLSVRRQYMDKGIGRICPKIFKLWKKINMMQQVVLLIGLRCLSLRLNALKRPIFS